VPTFNLVIADTEGSIAVQSAGRIPLRPQPERGYRPGWDPAHQWTGLLPFEAMPHAVDPPRGWLATANNRLAGADYPYPLYGCWISGYRAMRIRQMLEARLDKSMTVDDFRDIQQDTVSLRAVDCLPPLLAALSNVDDPRVQAAARYLSEWDGRAEVELVAPTLFNVFYTFWSQAVANARFQGVTAELLAKQAEHMANRLLRDDPHGWFPPGERLPTLQRAMVRTLDYLSERLGADRSAWQWGKLHVMPLKHVLASRGDLGQLLNNRCVPVKGDTTTVCNTGTGADWEAVSGAGYRLIADLSSDGLWAVDASSQSGQPGTPHYSDQLEAWAGGEYHFLPLDAAEVAQIAAHRLVIQPR
jgi:penicillin amidase